MKLANLKSVFSHSTYPHLYSPVEGLLFLCGWPSSLRPLQIKSHCLIRCTLEIVSVCIRLDWFTLANIPSLLCRQRLHMSCGPFCLGWGSVPHVQREIFVFFLINALEECSGQMDSSRHLSFQVLYYLVTFFAFLYRFRSSSKWVWGAVPLSSGDTSLRF